MKIKFSEFFSNESVFREAEKYWHAMLEMLPCLPMSSGWEMWGTASYKWRFEGAANIYQAINAKKRRAIVIVQCEPSDNPKQLVAWTGTLGEGFDDDLPAVDYVKINLVHTDETEKIALTLLERFVCGAASLKEMDQLIAELGVG